MRRDRVFGALALLLISTGSSAQQASTAPAPGSTQSTIQLPAQSTPTACDSGTVTGAETPTAAMPHQCGHSTPTS